MPDVRFKSHRVDGGESEMQGLTTNPYVPTKIVEKKIFKDLKNSLTDNAGNSFLRLSKFTPYIIAVISTRNLLS